MSTSDTPRRLAVFARLGPVDDTPRADEHRIGTIALDQRGGVAAALVALFRAAAFEVEQETRATPGEEGPP